MKIPALLLALPLTAVAAPLTKTILYVTQTPVPDEFLSQTHVIADTRINITTTMQSPVGDPSAAPRGGALWICYADGTKRNLTSAAGYGGPVDGNGNAQGFQGASGIAVQRPFMHWSGTKAIFAMIVGAPVSAADPTVFHWQLYEITGFGQGQTPVIARVQGQPAGYNNMQACYDTQDRIIFVSDAPRAMQAHLYPQLDEYMSLPCNTGLWRLDRAHSDELRHIVHCPSGAFTPFVDSYGRVIFVQWDHLSRDVSATYDRPPIAANGDNWTQTFNGNGDFASEAAGAAFSQGTPANYQARNGYPEPRNFDKTALVLAGANINANTTNHFFPWECTEDGANHEMVNHVGRHELGGSLGRTSFTDDANLIPLTFSFPTALNFMHLTESPASPGTFYAVNPPEFGTHCAGPIVRFDGPPSLNPDLMRVTLVTAPVGIPNPALPPPVGTPLTTPADVYRNPVPLSDGSLLVSTAAVTQYDSNNGTASSPKSRYAFRLRMMQGSAPSMSPDTVNNPTSPANVSISYYAGGSLLTYAGAPLWEIDPVEVIARARPAPVSAAINPVEASVFADTGVHIPTMQNYLRTRNLAMVANRNSLHRDIADKLQPYNLRNAWTSATMLGAPVSGVTQKVYDIGWLQIFQADALRGYTWNGANPAALPLPGRRLMPVPLHDTTAEMPPVPGAPPGAVKLGSDTSWAAIVPAGRAVSWHLLDGAGTKSQIKERIWVSFAPGEIRTCAVCHGVNTKDQAGNSGVPQNKPEALRDLLLFWKANNPPGTLQHAAPAVSVLKNAGSVTLNITRTGGSTGPASVDFNTVSGSAAAGTDFTPVSGTLTWQDGETAAKPVTVPVLHPAAVSGGKSFTVSLSGAQYASTGNPASAVVSIDEPPFGAWQWSSFGAAANTAAAAPLSDPDNDSLSNLLEFVLAGDPKAPAPVSFPITAGPGGSLILTYDRRLQAAVLSCITVQTEWASDLAGPWSASGVVEETISVAGDIARIRATVSAAGRRLFVRISAAMNP